MIKPKKFIDTVENLTIFIDDKKNNLLNNVLIKDSNDANQSQIIISKGGEISELNGEKYLKLKNGIIINYGKNNNLASFNFEETNFNLKKFKTKTTTTPKIQELNSKTLITCLINLHINQNYENNINSLSCEKSILKNIYQEIYKRAYLPFYIPLLSVIVCFIILKSNKNLKYKKFKFQIFIFGMIIIILSQISVNIISLNNLNNIFTLLFPISLFSSRNSNFVIKLLILIYKFHLKKIENYIIKQEEIEKLILQNFII